MALELRAFAYSGWIVAAILLWIVLKEQQTPDPEPTDFTYQTGAPGLIYRHDRRTGQTEFSYAGRPWKEIDDQFSELVRDALKQSPSKPRKVPTPTETKASYSDLPDGAVVDRQAPTPTETKSSSTNSGDVFDEVARELPGFEVLEPDPPDPYEGLGAVVEETPPWKTTTPEDDDGWEPLPK